MGDIFCFELTIPRFCVIIPYAKSYVKRGEDVNEQSNKPTNEILENIAEQNKKMRNELRK